MQPHQSKIVVVSGIRDLDEGDPNRILEFLTEFIKSLESLSCTFRVGGARGTDTVALGVLGLAIENGVPLSVEVVVPFRMKDQPVEAKAMWDTVKKHKRVRLVELELPRDDMHRGYQVRNGIMLEGAPLRDMPKSADLLLAFCHRWRSSGGTHNTMFAARRLRIPTLALPLVGKEDPDD